MATTVQHFETLLCEHPWDSRTKISKHSG